MNATRNRRSTAHEARRDADNKYVSSLDAADDADDESNAFPLDVLRRRAQRGEISPGVLHDACRAHMARRWRSLCNDRGGGRYPDWHEVEANAADAFSSLVMAYGELLDGADKVTGVVNRAIENRYLDVGRKFSRRVRIDSSLDDPQYIERADATVGDDAIDQAEDMADVRAIAFPAIAKLLAEISVDPRCAFHLKGCEHAELVINVLRWYLEHPGVDPYWYLGELGRQLGYSRSNHSTQEHLDCCYEWWQYRVFAGTAADPPDGTADEDPVRDWIRWPILMRFQLTKTKRGTAWNARVVRLESARHILRTDERFGALLRKHKPESYEFLEGGAS